MLPIQFRENEPPSQVITLKNQLFGGPMFELCLSRSAMDLTGNFPTQAGASMTINTGPRRRARGWSRLFHTTYPGIDGLYYASSMYANKPCVALYERSDPHGIGPLSIHRALADPVIYSMLNRAGVTLGYSVV